MTFCVRGFSILLIYRWIFLALMDHISEINERWDQIARHLLLFNETGPERKMVDVSKKIREFYFPNGQKIDKTQYENLTTVNRRFI